MSYRLVFAVSRSYHFALGKMATAMASHSLRIWDNEFVWHPFSPMQAYRSENAPIIESGEGFFLIDTDGNRYLDGISSLWCNVHGHRVAAIDQAIRDQLDQIAHSTLLGLANVASVELARQLVSHTPAGLSKVFFFRRRRDGSGSGTKNRLPVPAS